MSWLLLTSLYLAALACVLAFLRGADEEEDDE